MKLSITTLQPCMLFALSVSTAPPRPPPPAGCSPTRLILYHYSVQASFALLASESMTLDCPEPFCRPQSYLMASLSTEFNSLLPSPNSWEGESDWLWTSFLLGPSLAGRQPLTQRPWGRCFHSLIFCCQKGLSYRTSQQEFRGEQVLRLAMSKTYLILHTITSLAPRFYVFQYFRILYSVYSHNRKLIQLTLEQHV